MTRTSRLLNPGLALLVTLGIALRIDRLARRELWTDEMEQLNNLSRSFWNLLTVYVPHMPGGFPGDYILTWPMAQLTLNKWGLALPHFITMLLGYYLFVQICSEEFRTPWGSLSAVLLFSINPNLVFHSLELRPYAVLPTVALLFYRVSRRAIERLEWSPAQKWRWAAVVFLTLTFHFYGVLMIAAFLAYHRISAQLAQRDLPPARTWLSIAVIAGFCALPIWLYFVWPGRNLRHSLDTFEYCGRTPIRILIFALGTLGEAPLRWLWKLEVLVLAASFALATPQRLQRAAAIAVMIVMPLGLIFLSDWRGQYWFIQRQFIWVMPFWALLMGHALEALVTRHETSIA